MNGRKKDIHNSITVEKWGKWACAEITFRLLFHYLGIILFFFIIYLQLLVNYQATAMYSRTWLHPDNYMISNYFKTLIYLFYKRDQQQNVPLIAPPQDSVSAYFIISLPTTKFCTLFLICFYITYCFCITTNMIGLSTLC